jgi:hypothetical protein
MSPKKFWKLSFYEWSLWVNRIRSLQDKRQEDRNLLIELERNSMALFANAHKDRKAGLFKGSDFYPLPGDEVQKKKTKRLSAKDLEKEMSKRVRRRRK